MSNRNKRKVAILTPEEIVRWHELVAEMIPAADKYGEHAHDEVFAVFLDEFPRLKEFEKVKFPVLPRA